MKTYILEFREPHLIRRYAEKILSFWEKNALPKIRVMEICGGHTHVILKYGIHTLLEDAVEFIHGPGCPVCVTPVERIDQAIFLSRVKDVILVTLGDMMKVPGSTSSLVEERASGRDIRVVYSPLDVVKIAEENPHKKVVYFAIGFETTAPSTCAMLERCIERNLKNVFVHMNHVLIPPALHAVMNDRDVRIEAFIGPGHVSTIIGATPYEEVVRKYKIPFVVSGFEPLDILQSIFMIFRQINEDKSRVEIQYLRSVRWQGNERAREIIKNFFDTRDFRWRGLGVIPESGLCLKEEYAEFDAERVFSEILSEVTEKGDPPGCRCADVLRGKVKPKECSLFREVCTPENPVGACMVSSEGACHAYYLYAREE